MNETIYRITTKDNMEIFMKIRIKILREGNDLSDEWGKDEWESLRKWLKF